MSDRLAEVRRRIDKAAGRAGRDPAGIEIVVIGKSRTPAAIRELYEAGQRDFGENRAAELVDKAAVLPADIHWHFVGPLQRNKVRHVRPLVVLLHSLDRMELGEAWLKGPGAAPPALLEINIGREPQKLGFSPDEAAMAAGSLIGLGVDLRGVMAIPPAVRVAEEARPFFAELRSIRDALRERWTSITEISAGMTDDFEVAVEEGATIIRPGRAIFEADEEG